MQCGGNCAIRTKNGEVDLVTLNAKSHSFKFLSCGFLADVHANHINGKGTEKWISLQNGPQFGWQI